MFRENFQNILITNIHAYKFSENYDYKKRKIFLKKELTPQHNHVIIKIIKHKGVVHMDKRKNYYLLIDVETAGGLDKKLIYDIGMAIIDKKGNIYEERSFLIKEIFDNKSLMNTAYYKEKIPMYLEGLKKGEFVKTSWIKAIVVLNEMVKKYNVKTVCAYNLEFDKNAMANTHKYLGYNGKVLQFPMKVFCIWGLACETIFSQKSYSKVATSNNWISKAGNMRTNAEVAYRYITGDYNFIEEHTGLSDVKIEAKIMAQCLRQKKKISKGIISHPWKIPNRS